MVEELPASAEELDPTRRRGIGWIKLVCGVTSVACFGMGIRAAWVQARPIRPGELTRRGILTGSSIAMQALGIATVITVSGYLTFVILVSEMLGVDSWKQFGRKMTNMFGDRFRIAKDGGENYASLTELFEAAERQQRKK